MDTIALIVILFISLSISLCLFRYCCPSCCCRRIKYHGYRESNSPRPRRDKINIINYEVDNRERLLQILKNIAAWIRIHCPCSFSFTHSMSLNDAISRYEEYPPESRDNFFDNLSKNLYVNSILQYINEKLPKFYFKILPSGSLRERFGTKLPSTSILATDYDLMLVPDGIYVYDKHTEQDRDFPATFLAVDDPNENPNTPSGYLWLLLRRRIDTVERFMLSTSDEIWR